MNEKIALSAIKADVGGFVGHTSVHPAIGAICREHLAKARNAGVLVDFEVGGASATTSTSRPRRNERNARPSKE